VLVGLGQQVYAMVLVVRDDLGPHLAAHMPVAAFLGEVQLATDLEMTPPGGIAARLIVK
jgi:hypothetical protein